MKVEREECANNANNYMHSYQLTWIKRKKSDHDDGDNFSMKHMICFSMIQQQQTRDEHLAYRQVMMQIMTMTMTMMQIHTNGATENDAINERLNAMMDNLASHTMTAEPSIGSSGGTEQMGDNDNQNSNDSS